MPKTEKAKIKKSEDKTIKESRKIPVGVQIISVLYYIMTALLIVSGLFIILFSGIIVSTIISIDANLSSIITSQMIIWIGISFLILGGLIFFVGRGLWKLKLWAKITAILISGLMIIYYIYSLTLGFKPMQLIQLLIYVAIAVYLIFDRKAKKSFN
ncbi:MAG TPA: DUF2127 domain-containing protein [Candidatus Pacearchaeota archaeon]|nr:DUF2127 domain-containing protein [Candidatus Pacearchaeota archaeon]